MKYTARQLLTLTEQQIVNEIGLLTEAVQAYKNRIPDNRARSREALVSEAEQRLFNYLLFLGKFDDAEKYVQTKKQGALLAALRAAIEAPDTAVCTCTNDPIFGRDNNTEANRFVMWRKIKHPDGYWVNVYRCVKCSFMNATNNYSPALSGTGRKHNS